MTAVAFCSSQDARGILQHRVWAGQSMDSCLVLTKISDTFQVTPHTSNFAKVTSEESPVGKQLWFTETITCKARAYSEAMCMVSEESLSLFNLTTQLDESQTWLREKPVGRPGCPVHLNAAHAHAHPQTPFLPEVSGAGKGVHYTMLRIHLFPRI